MLAKLILNMFLFKKKNQKHKNYSLNSSCRASLPAGPWPTMTQRRLAAHSWRITSQLWLLPLLAILAPISPNTENSWGLTECTLLTHSKPNYHTPSGGFGKNSPVTYILHMIKAQGTSSAIVFEGFRGERFIMAV